jgi:hypothetical protein
LLCLVSLLIAIPSLFVRALKIFCMRVVYRHELYLRHT